MALRDAFILAELGGSPFMPVGAKQQGFQAPQAQMTGPIGASGASQQNKFAQPNTCQNCGGRLGPGGECPNCPGMQGQQGIKGAGDMNGIERMKLHEELLALKRRVLKLDEVAGQNCKHGIPSDSCKFCQGTPAPDPMDESAACSSRRSSAMDGPAMDENVGAGSGNPGSGLETQRVSSGPSSRTGMDESFGEPGQTDKGQDAKYSGDRKRGHEGDPHLEESLDGYYRIAGLL